MNEWYINNSLTVKRQDRFTSLILGAMKDKRGILSYIYITKTLCAFSKRGVNILLWLWNIIARREQTSMCVSHTHTCCGSQSDDLSEEWVQWCRCMAVSSPTLSEASRLVGLRPEAVHLPIWHQPEWWACGNVTNDQTVMIQWQVKRAIDCHWKFI